MPSLKEGGEVLLGLGQLVQEVRPTVCHRRSSADSSDSEGPEKPGHSNEDCEAEFHALKACLCSLPVLRSPDFSQRFLVQTDASAVGLGAVLAQGEPGDERPVLYLSCKLLPQETRYSTAEKEGLAIKWALESLRYYLLGREFDLEMDHRALTWMNSMKDHNSCFTRWYLSLQPFQFQS